MMKLHRAFHTTLQPATVARRRIRLVGLRRALAALEAGERINDELHQWTITPRQSRLHPVRRGL
jgi:hypothetical protein